MSRTLVTFDQSEIRQSIPARFGQMVRTYGSKPAIVHRGKVFSYAELDDFSSRIAFAIDVLCEGRRKPVAILAAPGIDQIAAIIGALKAGKIYVALDPAEPLDRLTSIFNEAGIVSVVTDEVNRQAAALAANDRQTILNLQDVGNSINSKEAFSEILPADPAYIFYTSGTTGRHKGVVDSHRNVLHNIMRYTNNLRICSDDRLTLLQSCNYSGSVSSLFCALLNGATVYPFDVRGEGAVALADLLIDEKITIYHSVPSLFESVIETGRSFPDIRVIRLEGDVCKPRHVALFAKHFNSGCLLANGLGATETGLSHQLILNSDSSIDSNVVPVGYPAEDFDAVLLDENGTSVSNGQIGEICIVSRYLAMGYWGDKELTDQVFQKISGTDSRMYRSGDLGRINSNGALEHLGRKDFQVKIRGHRLDIELLERTISDLPEVARAVVRGHENKFDHQQLIAYFVAEAGYHETTETSIRRQLADKLPSYMLPSRFIELTELPVDANGKVSKKDLPRPDNGRPILDQPFAKPETTTEREIAEIWCSLLGIRKIGLDDDFFELGGDSMLAVTLPILIKEKLSKSISDAVILEASTVRAMARILESTVDSHCLVSIQPAGSQPPVFLIHAHTGRVLEYRDLSGLLGPQTPFFAFQPIGMDGSSQPLTSISDMAAKYVREIQSVQPDGPFIVCGYCLGGLIAYEMGRLFALEGVNQCRIVMVDTEYPSSTGWKRFLPRTAISRIRRSMSNPKIEEEIAAPAAVQAAIDTAYWRYQPRDISSDVTHISIGPESAKHASQLSGWESKVKGTLRKIVLPRSEGTDEYRHFFHEPYLTMLANTLKDIQRSII